MYHFLPESLVVQLTITLRLRVADTWFLLQAPLLSCSCFFSCLPLGSAVHSVPGFRSSETVLRMLSPSVLASDSLCR